MSSKHKKKRFKHYSGEDAAVPTSSEPVIHRSTAVDRGTVGQWWFEKKRSVKIISIIAGVLTILTWLVVTLIQLIF